jgi:hypothetical protein
MLFWTIFWIVISTILLFVSLISYISNKNNRIRNLEDIIKVSAAMNGRYYLDLQSYKEHSGGEHIDIPRFCLLKHIGVYPKTSIVEELINDEIASGTPYSKSYIYSEIYLKAATLYEIAKDNWPPTKYSATMRYIMVDFIFNFIKVVFENAIGKVEVPFDELKKRVIPKQYTDRRVTSFFEHILNLFKDNPYNERRGRFEARSPISNDYSPEKLAQYLEERITRIYAGEG